MHINRLFEIVYVLLMKKIVTAKELAERFEVSQRTIYRDIETLSEAGIPIYANRGKGGGICLMDQFILNKSLLTDQEQKDILAALQGIQATSYEGASSTLSKLKSLFQNDSPDWIEVDFSYWNSREEDRERFMQLKDAIIKRKVISFVYYNSYGQESFRVVEPLKLIFRGQAWYLSAFCREKQSVRYFKISRMETLKLTGDIFEPRPAHALEAAEAVSDHAEMSRQKVTGQESMITLKIGASMAFRVYDEFPKEAINRLEDGSFLVSSPILPSGWLYGYLLSYGDQLEVLEPEELRLQMAEKIKSLNQIYNI
jgi:predicted DNA-binding transcriptional regulator YafY